MKTVLQAVLITVTDVDSLKVYAAGAVGIFATIASDIKEIVGIAIALATLYYTWAKAKREHKAMLCSVGDPSKCPLKSKNRGESVDVGTNGTFSAM